MSASLVGSEMCIRDSSRALCAICTQPIKVCKCRPPFALSAEQTQPTLHQLFRVARTGPQGVAEPRDVA
eukprot:8726459-Alexandrium_andersonii.AAC.1